MKMVVVGAGSWGSAFARYLGNLGRPTMLWVREPEVIDELTRTRENKTFLRGFIFPDTVSFTRDIKTAVNFGQLIFVAVPSQYCRSIYKKMAPCLNSSQVVISLTKGLDRNTLQTMSEVMKEEFKEYCQPQLAVVSGPSFAREVAAGYPTALVVASKNRNVAATVQRQISSLTLRAYTSLDVTGVEIAGALKNVVAIAAGIIDSLKFGLNSRAALITRGNVEITRLGMAVGAKRETFSGLAGIGDLVLTCTGELSRNHWVGQQLGQGKSLREIISGMKMIAEGVHTTLSARKLARSVRVEMPISEEIYRVLYKGKPVNQAVQDLMSRTLKHEF